MFPVFKTVSCDLRLFLRGRENPGWILFGLLAGMLSGVVFVGCKSGNSSDMWTRLPKLTPTPLTIPQIWHESFDKALEESTATGKPILANFTGTDWCHWCVKLKSDVFETDTFGTWAKSKVVLLSLDYPKRSMQSSQNQQQNQQLKDRFKISSFPTILFLDSQGNLIGKGPGYSDDPQAWIDQADATLEKGIEE